MPCPALQDRGVGEAPGSRGRGTEGKVGSAGCRLSCGFHGEERAWDGCVGVLPVDSRVYPGAGCCLVPGPGVIRTGEYWPRVRRGWLGAGSGLVRI